LAVAWWWLAGLTGHRLGLLAGYSVWARSQWAKYLPGNAFHYVSRQVLGRRAGLSHAALVASSGFELGSLLLAAVLVALTAALAGGNSVNRSVLGGGLLLGLALLSAWPLLDAGLRRFFPGRRFLADLPRLSFGQTWRLLGPGVALHVVFFLATGGLFYGLLGSGWGVGLIPLETCVRIFALAWLAGTITVGAPAGAGVREAILTLEFTPVLGAANASALALALRLVTLGGDGLTALAGFWSARHLSASSQPSADAPGTLDAPAP
jgi:glycosyltransferase 2 family protein